MPVFYQRSVTDDLDRGNVRIAVEVVADSSRMGAPHDHMIVVTPQRVRDLILGLFVIVGADRRGVEAIGELRQGMIGILEDPQLRAIRFQVLDARTWPSWVAEEPPFDLVFSNFGGLNCLSLQQLSALAPHIDTALKPGGYFVAVVMGRFCWWETLYFLLKGKWASAFRRSKEIGFAFPGTIGSSVKAIRLKVR